MKLTVVLSILKLIKVITYLGEILTWKLIKIWSKYFRLCMIGDQTWNWGKIKLQIKWSSKKGKLNAHLLQSLWLTINLKSINLLTAYLNQLMLITYKFHSSISELLNKSLINGKVLIYKINNRALASIIKQRLRLRKSLLKIIPIKKVFKIMNNLKKEWHLFRRCRKNLTLWTNPSELLYYTWK